MTIALVSLLRRLAACATRGLCTASGRIAVVVGIAVAIASSAHASVAPFEVPLVMGSWVAYKGQSTETAARAIYESQYKSLAGVRIAMSSAGRHFIMLDDPAWFEATLEEFVARRVTIDGDVAPATRMCLRARRTSDVA